MQLFEMPSSGQPQEGSMRSTFVLRLERLVQMHESFRQDLNQKGTKLLDHSIKATYRDCMACGAGEEARRIIARSGYGGELR